MKQSYRKTNNWNDFWEKKEKINASFLNAVK